MSEDALQIRFEIIELTGRIVSAHVSNNHVAIADLPGLIAAAHASLAELAFGRPASPETVERPNVAQIRRSVQRDGIVSFIDGRSYKTLKRHLTAHGLDPHSYRERYGLPAEYPMVAPGYAERRSSLAKAIGLGVPGARKAA